MQFSVPSPQDFDPESFTLAEADLRQALDGYLQQGSGVLDLRAHGEALSSSSGELMELFADACRRTQRPVRLLRLPGGLDVLPSWVGAFAQASCLAGAPSALAA